MLENAASAPSHRAYAASLLYVGLRLSQRFDEAKPLYEQAMVLLSSAMNRAAAEDRWAHWVMSQRDTNE